MSHYYDQEQGPFRPTSISFSLLGKAFSASGGSGIFSKDELDKATRLLIETCIPLLRGSSTVLDLGCGWGAVSIALSHFCPHLSITASDVNKSAVRQTKRNVPPQVIVQQGDGFEKIPQNFDSILLNPPYAAGRKVCYALIEQSRDHLNSGGVFYLVARHQKGGAMLEKFMLERYGNVDVLAKKGGFRVYASRKEEK